MCLFAIVRVDIMYILVAKMSSNSLGYFVPMSWLTKGNNVS